MAGSATLPDSPGDLSPRDLSHQSPAAIAAMFGRVAPRYDLMNFAMGAGIDIYWRWKLVRAVLDPIVAAGLLKDDSLVVGLDGTQFDSLDDARAHLDGIGVLVVALDALGPEPAAALRRVVDGRCGLAVEGCAGG